MANKILAKSKPFEESLIVHTENTLSVWYDLKNRYQSSLKEDEAFWKKSFLSILFHDFGKVTQNFQWVIQKKKKYNKSEYIRHEFVSGVFLYYSNVKVFEQTPYCIFAVFSHHQPLTDTLFQDDGFVDITATEEDMLHILEDFNSKLQSVGIEKLNLKLIPYCIKRFQIKDNGISKLYDDFQKFLKVYLGRQDLSQSVRKEYILYKAILNIADWTASGHDKLPDSFNFSLEYLKNKIIEKLRDEGKKEIANNFTFRTFQLDSLQQGNVLAIAPTGSGKTEASLIWASQKPEHSKILYLLPTRVTSNAIYKRLTSYFDKENTAVVHSSALLYRKEIEDNFEKTEYLKDKTFFKNITVCTIDQILTQGFNLGYWEIKTFHLLKSKIIIDEIHLYHPYTLGLIISTIEYLKNEFGAEFFIMTATMPSKLKQLLQKTLEISDSSLIQDIELLNEARNTFEVRDKLIDDLDDEIKKAIKKNKKVLIVVNTVDEAIRLYKKYKSQVDYPICFHSRFIQKDRFEKEQDILEREKQGMSMLLIATQVVEVSLDIDFDILFTENAPIDAIIQRAGRVNRKRDKAKKTKVIVFKHQPVSEEHIYVTVPEILDKTFEQLKNNHKKKLTEKELNNLVDIVYKDFDVETHNSYIEGKKKYFEVQKNHHFIKDNLEIDKVFTREGIDSTNVIPSCFEEELYKESPEYKSKYELSISYKKTKYIRTYQDKTHNWFKYINASYDSEIGLTFDKKSNAELGLF